MLDNKDLEIELKGIEFEIRTIKAEQLKINEKLDLLIKKFNNFYFTYSSDEASE